MKYTTGHVGRVVTIRFDDGDPLYKGIEETARKENIRCGVVWLVGGVKNGGVVVGPSDDSMPPIPSVVHFADPREIIGVGTLFPDENSNPSLHLHASIGKGSTVVTGCPRKGLDCWLVTEAILLEMTDTAGVRLINEKSGLSLLEITG